MRSQLEGELRDQIEAEFEARFSSEKKEVREPPHSAGKFEQIKTVEQLKQIVARGLLGKLTEQEEEEASNPKIVCL